MSIERHAHPVEQIDNLRSPIAHFVDRRLIGQKIAAENGLIEMGPFAVSLLAGDIIAGIDPALRRRYGSI